jgi:hypothetical protein
MRPGPIAFNGVNSLSEPLAPPDAHATRKLAGIDFPAIFKSVKP